MRTMEESIEQKAQERADRKLQYIIGSWEVFSLAFMELCKENAPVTPTKASEA